MHWWKTKDTKKQNKIKNQIVPFCYPMNLLLMHLMNKLVGEFTIKPQNELVENVLHNLHDSYFVEIFIFSHSFWIN